MRSFWKAVWEVIKTCLTMLILFFLIITVGLFNNIRAIFEEMFEDAQERRRKKREELGAL